MRPTLFSFAGPLALSGFVAAQFSDYPSCADPCLNEYIPQTGCDLDDIRCRCYAEIAKPDLFNSIVSCLSGDCDLSDLEKAQDTASSLCESATAADNSKTATATTAAAGTVTSVAVPTNNQESTASITSSSDLTVPTDTSDGGSGDSGDSSGSGSSSGSSSSSSSGHTYTGKHGKHGRLSTGGIAGIAVGVGLAALFAIGLVAFWLWKRHARSKAMAQGLAAAEPGAAYSNNGKPELEPTVTAQFPHSTTPSTVVATPPPNQTNSSNYGPPAAQVSPHEAYGTQIPSPSTYHEVNANQVPAAAPYYEADANQVPITTHEMPAWQSYEMPSERH